MTDYSLSSMLTAGFSTDIARAAAWEDRFARWSNPPSNTEAEKIERTERMIREAVGANEYLSGLDIRIIVQGSYRNNTNIRSESDVDICVLMRNTYHYATLPGARRRSNIFHQPIVYHPAELKQALHGALINKFGVQNVEWGNKCIKIHSTTARVNADVVAAITHRLYIPAAGHEIDINTPALEGIAIHPDSGSIIINWPEQHYQNGCTKNIETGQRFKSIVRVLKILNLEMENTAYSPIQSFLVESLVYNCPEHCFVSNALYTNVQNVLTHISFLSGIFGNSNNWYEVNGIKKLFDSTQPWNINDAIRFVNRAQRRLAESP